VPTEAAGVDGGGDSDGGERLRLRMAATAEAHAAALQVRRTARVSHHLVLSWAQVGLVGFKAIPG
jgi:hypothetical protein